MDAVPVVSEAHHYSLDVRYWHLADIPPPLTNVRYRG